MCCATKKNLDWASGREIGYVGQTVFGFLFYLLIFSS
jgi:hypothetical protein